MTAVSEIWDIVYYQVPQGNNFPVYDFINSLDPKAKSKVINTINLLESYGTRLHLPHAKKLAATNLWELRILGSDSIRILYVTVADKKFLLLHGFLKKKQKIDRREIKIALERLKEYRSRK